MKKEIVNKYLTDLGYKNIDWFVGRKGDYILAFSPYGGKMCIEPDKVLKEIQKTT